MNGVADCRIFEYKETLTVSRTAKETRNLVDNFYSDKARLSVSVTDAIRSFDNVAGTERPKGAEAWTEAHGYWDGLWWKGSSPDERLGFVQGYLDCISEKPARVRPRFSKAPAEYMDLINKWYGLDDSKHSINPSREDEKIGDVLRRLKDL